MRKRALVLATTAALAALATGWGCSPADDGVNSKAGNVILRDASMGEASAGDAGKGDASDASSGDSGDAGIGNPSDAGDAGDAALPPCAKRSFSTTIVSKSYIAAMANGGGYGECPSIATYPGGQCGGCSSFTVQQAWYSGFGWITDASYNEDPQKNLGSNNYRIGAQATMTWDCEGGKVTNARLQTSSSGGGQEAPTIYGVSHFTDKPNSAPTGGNSVPLPDGKYDYLEWGFPNSDLEPPFQQIATRSNASIWHVVQTYLGCSADNSGGIQAQLAGTPFPSHRLWADVSETTNNAANAVSSDMKQIDQGKFELLWYLPQVPTVGVLPSNAYPFISFYADPARPLNATADPTVVSINAKAPAPKVPPPACTPFNPPPAGPPSCTITDANDAVIPGVLMTCISQTMYPGNVGCWPLGAAARPFKGATGAPLCPPGDYGP